MSKASVRFQLVAFGDNEFRATDVVDKWPHGALYKLEQAGEIECVRIERNDKAANKRQKVYRVIELNFGEKQVKEIDLFSAWRLLWPEFFVDPRLPGTVRKIRFEEDCA